MKTARLVACLVVASLLLPSMICLGAGRPKTGVLIVSRSRIAREESVAKTLAEQVFRLLELKGLAQDVPIVLYHFEKPEERDHCTLRLKISVADLPCAALVDLDAHGIPLRVKKKYPQVVSTEAMANSVLSSLGADSSQPNRASPVAVLSSTPVAARKSVPMRPDAGVRVLLGVSIDDTAKDKGCHIVGVNADGCGQRAGLKIGDILIRVGDLTVNKSRELREALKTMKRDRPVPLTLQTPQGEATLMCQLSLPTSLKSFEIVEGIGLPGCIAVGDDLQGITDRLGKPTSSSADSREMLVKYDSLGLLIVFNARNKVKMIGFIWPFVGQTSCGVPTDGKKQDVYSAYGKPDSEADVDAKSKSSLRTIDYTSIGVKVYTTSTGEIAGIMVFSPSKKQ